ncbi:hypothetical protein OG455_38945 [Kitasatospora sp. NBC_01287]|uniref:hypothetical protein n=1 Tax=Kitasatospora sp. NBC_01287 TaxID=2903573 RepID=UPI0022521B8A|nr:hypothetical protein [Kitasatospora sp. NBC_01287]MCX4751413.1 hypothetical protein [Kitasatospora sp. NBC_01287]
MTTAPEQPTVYVDEQRFPCKYDGPADFARLHIDAEGDIGLLVRSGDPNANPASIYLNPEVAESLGQSLVNVAARSRVIAEEIRRVQAQEAEAARRLGEMEAARQAEEARQAGTPFMVAGGSTSPAALPQTALADTLVRQSTATVGAQVPSFADTMLPQSDNTAERERAFLRASELLGPDAGVAARIAMANYLLQGGHQ